MLGQQDFMQMYLDLNNQQVTDVPAADFNVELDVATEDEIRFAKDQYRATHSTHMF